MGAGISADAKKLFLDSFEFAIRRHEFVNRDVCKEFYCEVSLFLPKAAGLDQVVASAD
jgi:hypothetical protein